MKVGWKTTEFWLTLATVAMALAPVAQEFWQGVQPVVPDQWRPLMASVAVVGYALSRALTKSLPILAQTIVQEEKKGPSEL